MTDNALSHAEKTRLDHVQKVEATAAHASAEVVRLRALVERWQPIVTAAAHTADESVRVTLSFGGKVATATMTQAYLKQADQATATAAIIQTLLDGLVADRLREVVEPEVARVRHGLLAVDQAGKW